MDFLPIDRLIENAVKDGAFPSAAAAVGRGGRVLHEVCRGVTRLDGGIPVNEYTLYDMASLSKVLGPTMITLRAIEDGILTLDDALPDFFGGLVPQDKQGIRLRHLMTHTSGIIPSIPLYLRCKSPDEAVETILREPLAGPVGETPRYSCMNYILLAKILEKVFGQPLNLLARERVFAPVQMLDTAYCPAFSENIAATEVDKETNKPWQGIVHDENARFLNGVSGNAGVFSNLRDCEKFAMMLAQSGKGLLSPATLRKAIHNYTPGQESHRGLGFHLAGVEESYCGDLFPDDSFGHTGFTGTSIVVDPGTGIFAVLLTNRVHPTRDNMAFSRVRRTLHNLTYSILSRDEGELF